MNLPELSRNASALFEGAKGILAADESTKTVGKRFASLGLTSTPELNRKYRQLYVSAEGIEGYISGIILYEETAKQKTDTGVPFVEFILEKGILPGIKADGGLVPFGEGEEQVTKGLEGLGEKLARYKQEGFAFSKWRAVVKISDLYPSEGCLKENSRIMAEYASASQGAGLVAVVEPEVLMDGNHTTARCEEITKKTLNAVFEELKKQNIDLSGVILKVNMVLPGKDSTVKAEPLEVAGATVRALRQCVPADIAGVVFLSGGQTSKEATANLNEIAKTSPSLPWPVSFSFLRALHSEALEVWKAKEENVKKAQRIFIKRAKLVSLAVQGRYLPEMEKEMEENEQSV